MKTCLSRRVGGVLLNRQLDIAGGSSSSSSDGSVKRTRGAGGRGGARLNVHRATVKSMRRSVRSNRRRILQLRRQWRSDQRTAVDLSNSASPALLLKKMMSTDSGQVDVDGSDCSEDEHEDSRLAIPREHGLDADSGCDEWDLCKKRRLATDDL